MQKGCISRQAQTGLWPFETQGQNIPSTSLPAILLPSVQLHAFFPPLLSLHFLITEHRKPFNSVCTCQGRLEERDAGVAVI